MSKVKCTLSNFEGKTEIKPKKNFDVISEVKKYHHERIKSFEIDSEYLTKLDLNEKQKKNFNQCGWCNIEIPGDHDLFENCFIYKNVKRSIAVADNT